MNVLGDSALGIANVIITNNGSHSPEQWAEMATDQIIHVGSNSHPAIIEQARAFREQIYKTLVYYFAQVQEAERADISRRL